MSIFQLTLIFTIFQGFVLMRADSDIKVSGTSTLHDWEMEVQEVKGKSVVHMNEQGHLVLDQVDIIVPVESMESGKSMMNKYTYEALKSKEHPNIRFKANDCISKGGNNYLVKGALTIGGQTKHINVPLTATLISTDRIKVVGSKQLKMTDYGVEPPTVMFGSVSTGDEVTVSFSFVHKLKN